mgnify:FL=1
MSVDILTFSVNKDAENVSGRILERQAEVTLSSGYPTGGYTFPVALNDQYGQLGIRTLIGLFQVACNTAALAYIPFWNSQTGKLMIVNDLTGQEVPDNTDLDALTMTLRLLGSR